METDLTLGHLVAFGNYLTRKTEQRPREPRFATSGRPTEPWKVWADAPVQHLFAPPTYLRPDARLEGLVIGLRTLQNGPVEWGSYEEPTVFYPRQTVPAVLVAWHLRRKPVLVRLNDLERIAP